MEFGVIWRIVSSPCFSKVSLCTPVDTRTDARPHDNAAPISLSIESPMTHTRDVSLFPLDVYRLVPSFPNKDSIAILMTSRLPKHTTVPPMRLKYCSISFTFDPAENGEFVGQTISGSTYQYMITLGK